MRRLPANWRCSWQVRDNCREPMALHFPLGFAILTGRLHGVVEDALADESGGTRGHILPVPEGPADGDYDPLAGLQADVTNLAAKRYSPRPRQPGGAKGWQPRHAQTGSRPVWERRHRRRWWTYAPNRRARGACRMRVAGGAIRSR